MNILPIIILLVVYLAVIVLMVVSMWKIYEKAQKPGWACIVPFYNFYVMVEIAKKPTWWFAMMFVPLANYVFMIMTINGISKSFGKDEGFTVGMVLLPFVFYPILGLGDAQYVYADQVDSSDLLDS